MPVFVIFHQIIAELIGKRGGRFNMFIQLCYKFILANGITCNVLNIKYMQAANFGQIVTYFYF